jgi:uncharacterized protein (TIGR03066 family)
MKSNTANQAPNRQAKVSHAGGSTAGRRKWLVMIAVAAVVAAASFTVFELVLPGRIPSELVGVWRVVGGKLNGMTLEFRRNGTMIGKAVVDGKDNEMEGEVAVRGRILRTTTTNPYTGKADTGTQTIISLTETELVTEDPTGARITMKRVR